ncbi:MAG: HDIG domain-containing protein [Verrucomicrobia bacterium]|nr:MAG: HDIG domain-containing protein [Verrucomicrobiota bacterium]
MSRLGFSSGKKRQVNCANPIVQALEKSIWIKLSLYFTFIAGTAVLVLSSSGEIAFADQAFKRALYALVIAATAVVMFQVTMRSRSQRNSRLFLVLGGLMLHLMILSAIMGMVNRGFFPEFYRFFLIPFALAPMLHGVLLGRPVGAFSAVYVTLLGCLLVPKNEVLNFMILSLVGGITCVLLVNKVRKRAQLLRAGIYAGAMTMILSMLLGRLDIVAVFGENSMQHLQGFGAGSLAAVGTSLLTALIISGLLPFFEGAFNLTTDISWLELSDLNHKLLREMQLEAPGTFHHSLIVASLAEAAAENIGANAPMCRVCAYFHDVGKLTKPGYFIENLNDGSENPHDALTPTMSAMIIIAHVKDGVDLALKHKLNPRILDVIQEHHGDSLVAYFYHKAREMKRAELEKVGRRIENPEDLPSVEEQNFRYPGKRPSTVESGIISLADCVESASRTIQKPTPAKIRTMIDSIVRSKMDDGQLDDCPLTIQQLAIIKDSFTNTLRSMMHNRISYPKDDSATAPPTKKLSISEHTPTEESTVVQMPKRA